MTIQASLTGEGKLVISNNGKTITSLSSLELQKFKEIFFEWHNGDYINKINKLFDGIKKDKIVEITIKKIINDYELDKATKALD